MSALYAAVDLGSNSFHMVVARATDDGELEVVDRIKNRVRLAAGLGADQSLSPESKQRALSCLAEFGERLRDLPAANVRAVGTNTLRKMRDGEAFLRAARAALGHRIEVVSGREEARLVYLGVSRDLGPAQDGKRLVVDIGGGSTELIIGERDATLRLDSLYMGCVSYSQRFFPDGVLSAKAFKKAVTAARLELKPAVKAFRRAGWDHAMGSSGTIKAAEAVILASELSTSVITPEALDGVRRQVIAAEHIDALSLPGLSPERAAVFPGGLAILIAVFDALRVERMTASLGALREGLLVDLMGRVNDRDERSRSVERMARRYKVDTAQARRVQGTALAIFDQLQGAWALSPFSRQMLTWAAALHEIGVFVSYTGYHKHGAYILSQADMPGFSRQDQARLATLVLGHRGRLTPDRLTTYRTSHSETLHRLAIILRLARRLHRSRGGRVPAICVEATPDGMTLSFPPGWLDKQPLTRTDLETEARRLGANGVRLSLS